MRDYLVACILGLGLVSCGGGGNSSPDARPRADAAPPADGPGADAGGCVPTSPTKTAVTCGSGAQSNIEHLVVVVQENHSFDNYFGKWCTAATGSSPTCTSGPSCCEAAPDVAPGASSSSPIALDDTANGAFDPNHTFDCNLTQVNGGAMDGFVEGGSGCADAKNFAYADPSTGPAAPYVTYAQSYALADQYFQPVLGASSSNDMYFARAHFVFKDNTVGTNSIGGRCGFGGPAGTDYTDKTIADILNDCSVTWSWYGGGYDNMVTAVNGSSCPAAETGCHVNFQAYPCIYDPTDVPFQYYPSLQDKPANFKDITKFTADITNGTLPSVSFVKAIGFRTEHPGFQNTISEGATFVTGIVDAVLNSNTYKDNTLILLVYDEGGGYFDHVAPPPTSAVDCQPYGVRTIFMALGPMAKSNYISHVTMEHSSIVKFIEWNWLSGETGQLGTRDTEVNNIGDMIDSTAAGATVPAN